jgi:hypothetical protein
MPRLDRPRATTAVDDHYLRISARKDPNSNATMFNNAFRAATERRITTQICAIGCTMRNLTPDVHAEVHLCNLDTMQRGSDGPNNMLNGPLGIGITLSSPMSVAYAIDQAIVDFVFGGNLVRLNVFETVSSECSKVVVL